jgi:hypothetical protein
MLIFGTLPKICFAGGMTSFLFERKIRIFGINGREWLAQQMRQDGVHFQQEKNCFTRIEDFRRAQELMNQQLQTDWVGLLTGFQQRLNPLHEEIFAKYPTPYYWTCYQSEWATDIVFRKR